MQPNAPTMVGAALVGGLGWTLAEYLLHRFLMHAMRGRGLASREHLTHHARRDYFASSAQKALFSVVVTAVMVPVATFLIGLPHAIALQGGFVGTYLFYEWLHRRAHTHPPRGPYGRWLRLHHFHHHFGRPLENHGVTSPFWDAVFGTRVSPPRPIRVPRRMAMRWLLTPSGELDAAYADDYVLVGHGPVGAAVVSTPATVATDLAAAFANVPPAE
jgi:sterol desaturase/sphingolipid hydroxylase (fatty acid hydroxylase superfamily)